jgi:hypothetical protein
MDQNKILTFGDVNVPIKQFYDVNEPHISAYLSQLSKMVRNPALVWDQIFPRFTVVKKKNKIAVYGVEHMMRTDTRRAPKTPAKQATRHLGTAIEYDCQCHALGDLVGEEERANADPPINAEVDAMELLTNLIELDMEFQAYDLITTTGNYASADYYPTLSAGERWNEYGSTDSLPLKNIDDYKYQVWTGSGKRANTILIPYGTALALSRHPQLTDLVKYTHSDLLTAGGLPPVLKGLRVVEADTMYNTEIQGQTAALSGLWSDYVWIGYVNPRMGLKDTTWGLTFSRGGRIVRQWFEQKLKADWIEVEEQGVDMAIFDQNCGLLVQDTLA